MTREEAIEYLEIERTDYDIAVYKDSPIREALDIAIEALKQESLTDAEKRIFLSAMHREEKTCEKLDEEYKGYTKGTPLVPLCRGIVRKVRAALWEEQK